MNNKDYNRNPKGTNQWKLRTDKELQDIINSKPRNWTKKDFRGEGKLNKKKLMTRKETDRKTLKFYQKGRIYKRNLKDHYNNSTEETKVIYSGFLSGLLPAGPGQQAQAILIKLLEILQVCQVFQT